MNNFSGDIQQKIGNTYGFRNWIEYGLKQAKNELGWADFLLHKLLSDRKMVGDCLLRLFDG